MLKQVGTLLSGSALGQAAMLIALLVFARYIPPEEFGIYALLQTLVAWTSYASGGRFDSAIAVAERASHARVLLQVAAALNMLFFMAGAALVYAGWIGLVPNGWLLDGWLAALPIMALVNGCNLIWEAWVTRLGQYRTLALSRGLRGVLIAAFQLALLWARGDGVAALVLGHALGSLAALVLATRIDRGPFDALCRDVVPARWRIVMRRYSQFPRYNILHGLASASQEPLALLMLRSVAGPAAVGHYGFVLRVVAAPLSFASQAVAPVLLRRIAATADPEQRQAILREVMRVLGAIGVVPLGVLLVAGPELFTFAFSDRWVEAGRYAQAYAPFLVLSFIASPLGVVPQATGRLRGAFGISVAGNVLFITVLFAGLTVSGEVTTALLWISIAFAIYFPVYFRWLYTTCIRRGEQ